MLETKISLLPIVDVNKVLCNSNGLAISFLPEYAIQLEISETLKQYFFDFDSKKYPVVLKRLIDNKQNGQLIIVYSIYGLSSKTLKLKEIEKDNLKIVHIDELINFYFENNVGEI